MRFGWRVAPGRCPGATLGLRGSTVLAEDDARLIPGLPELPVRGLGDSDARALLLANVPGRHGDCLLGPGVKSSGPVLLSVTGSQTGQAPPGLSPRGEPSVFPGAMRRLET